MSDLNLSSSTLSVSEQLQEARVTPYQADIDHNDLSCDDIYELLKNFDPKNNFHVEAVEKPQASILSFNTIFTRLLY